ncbi:alpha-glucan family phosphorylase [Mucilaginibacter psychrotolerans]|uniref:Alpha-glucan family phosphorylase n=1 Tax=Mucilaginibacter psychrotolerans TaxID=1524096 RepID=A0A4Y8SG17_9SPHI|nr:alpha-glucan family phosphorylase [Mucilaginibacter psychrotolerans]TFF37497.1 alpha-glucan family phosphorylase [Mucilaginibacter psychrotolerans]
MAISRKDLFGYTPDPAYALPVAYFSMEFAIDQALKIYSGGLGFLSGSHLRSAFELKQNLIGIGILWKYGYYDQQRDRNGFMKPGFVEKEYSFLQDTGILFTITVHNAPVQVRAFLLRPETFGTAPLFLLSTDIPENDEESRSITHCLYDANEATRIAQSMVLGIGGGMLLDLLELTPAIYHLNEGHGVALNFYLYEKHKTLAEVRKRVVFTTHTPETAGNEEHSFELLGEMSFFYHLSIQEVRSLLKMETFNYTLAALKFARKANGVSKLHGEIARKMWAGYEGVCEITSITNAQNKNYWVDEVIGQAIAQNDRPAFNSRKTALKKQLFKIVADQCGMLFDERKLTIVWARRFAGYKRADLMMQDWDRFLKLIGNTQYPVQVIWAGKPYPEDAEGIALFNQIIGKARPLANCAVLIGYELALSASLKKGADVWLNNPRMYHEASGTSGMTAAMNGAVNLSMPDGWVPEFARDGENCFLIPTAIKEQPVEQMDRDENSNLMATLEKTVLPAYYTKPDQWFNMVKQAAADVDPAFESARMVRQYYELMYKTVLPEETKEQMQLAFE